MGETQPAQRHGKADASSAPQPLMSVRGLGIRFKTSQGVWQATRKIDFDIALGERVGIVGESGCGKTITGLSILRLLPIILPASTAPSCSTASISQNARRAPCVPSAAGALP